MSSNNDDYFEESLYSGSGVFLMYELIKLTFTFVTKLSKVFFFVVVVVNLPGFAFALCQCPSPQRGISQ